MPPIPEKPSLADWQKIVKETVAERHFSVDPNEVFVMFAEEVGELAKELRKKWKFGTVHVRESAGSELADVFQLLMDLANHFDVDLEQAVREKMKKNDGRTWEY